VEKYGRAGQDTNDSRTIMWQMRCAGCITKAINTDVPWLGRLVAGLSPRRPGFDPGSVHVGFVVDKVALGLVFPRVLRFSLSVSFHRCSITRKNEKTNHLHHRVAQ
jgi:hypothetical protein